MLNKWLKVIFYPSGGGEALLQGFQASFEGGHAPLSTWGHLSCRGALFTWPEFLKLYAHRPDPEVAEQLSAVASPGVPACTGPFDPACASTEGSPN